MALDSYPDPAHPAKKFWERSAFKAWFVLLVMTGVQAVTNDVDIVEAYKDQLIVLATGLLAVFGFTVAGPLASASKK